MLKDLLKEGGLYTLANFLTKGISLLLIPFYTAYFTPSEYGVIDILTVFGVFAGNIFSLQLNQGLARFVTEPSNSKSNKIEYASTAFITYLIFMSLFLLMAISFSNQIISQLSPNGLLEKDTFLLASIVIFLNNIFYFLNVYLRFIRKVKTVSFLSFLHAIFGILLLLYFVFQKGIRLNSFFLPFIIIVPFLIVTQLVILKDKLKPQFTFSKFKELAKYSIPLIGGAVALVLMNLIDRVFINSYLGENQLGVYGIGIKFASIIGIIVAGFGTALSPLIYEKYNKESTKTELSELFKLFIGIGVGGSLFISLFSMEIVRFFTSFSYYNAGKILPIMIFTTLFSGFLMFSPGLQIRKKTVMISFLALIFALLNVLMNYLLIPKYGLYGAAFSTLIATMLYAIIYFKLSNLVYSFKYSFLKTIIPFLFSLVVILIFSFYNFNNAFFYKIIIIVIYIWTTYKLGLFNRIIRNVKHNGKF